MKSEIYLHLLGVGPFSIQDLEKLNSDIEILARQFSSIEGLRKIRPKGGPSSVEYFIVDIFENNPTPIYSRYAQEEIGSLKAIKNSF